MTALQGLAWLLVLQAAGEALARAAHLPVPGPVIGLGLLWFAARWPLVRAPVQAAADLLLAHLSLLFVPVGVGVVTHLDALAGHGAQLAVVLVASTWVGLAVTALVLRAALRRGDDPPGASGDASTAPRAPGDRDG